MIVERRYGEAVDFCQLQLAASPRCVTLRLWMARALTSQGSTAAALAQLHECLRIDSSCAEARALLAKLEVRATVAATASLLDEDADKPTNVLRPRRPTPSAVRAAPAIAPPQPMAVEKPRPMAVERPRPIAVERPRPIAVERPRPIVVERPRSAVFVAPPPVAATPEPAVVVVAPARPIALAHDRPVAVAHQHPVAVARKRPRPPRRQAFASPFVDEPKASRAAARWERPLRIEARRPQPLLRVALAGLALAGLVALWRFGREETPMAPPAAAMAASPAHPSPEPPVAKADSAPFDVLGTDVWIHPLQGPARRMPIRDSRLFGAERLGDRPSECRGGHCGIDLAGDYGEPVYAVHEGVVDRVQRDANPSHGGHYVRLSHRGGTITTQYFHLSDIPRRLEEGVTVKAGELVGFVGLSGVRHSEPHLHFTIAVQDPSGADGRYLDPEPLVALWPLRVSHKGDERLHVSNTTPPGLARGFIRRHHHRHAPAPAAAPPESDESLAAE